jgi:hypothetical protein
MSALCHGSKAERSAHCFGSGLEQVVGFWNDYLKVGRCAIDPTHEKEFKSDRYSMEDEVRTCLWCGVQHDLVMTPRTVIDESWVPRIESLLSPI